VLQVDLSSKPRTKKLRSNESETVISGTEYSQRLRKQLAKLHGAQSWAQPKAADSASDSDSGGDGVKALLAKGGAIIDKGRSHALRRGTIDVLRCPDANAADPNSAVVQSVRFHPQSSVMLTAGLDKTLRLFNVDGAESSKIQGVHFSDLPIFCAEWSAHGNEIYCAGRRPYFYCYDVGKGCVSKVFPHPSRLASHWNCVSLKSASCRPRLFSVALLVTQCSRLSPAPSSHTCAPVCRSTASSAATIKQSTPFPYLRQAMP
jgi:U3 small nucleolar RNA-associated protein 18